MTGDRAPSVSFLLAVHNDARFLPGTLRSLFAQTFDDFEIVAIDDASTDGTAEILRSTGNLRLRYFRNETNIGQVPSLNDGLQRCRGELIARIDGDDICDPDRLAAQVRYLAEHPDLAGCATWTTEIDEDGNAVGAVEPCGDPDYVRWLMCHASRLYHSTMMLRRRALEEAGGYDVAYASGEDYELWARLIGAGQRLGVVPQHLVRYRRRRGSISDTHREVQNRFGRQISSRLAGQLLGRTCDERTVGLMKGLLSWQPFDPAAISPDAVAQALSLMADLREALLVRASAAARAAADEEVAEHLLRKARSSLDRAPAVSARLALYVARLPNHRLAALRVLAAATRRLTRRVFAARRLRA